MKITTLALISCICISITSMHAMDSETKRQKTFLVEPPYYPLETYDSDHTQEVIECAQAGAYNHLKDIFNRTPLHRAAHFGQTPLMKALIQGGISADCLDTHGNTPLHYAAESMHQEEAVELLIDACTAQRVSHDQRPYALLCGLVPMVDVMNNCGQTPLHLARDPKVVQLLIEAGANCHTRHYPHLQPETPFQAAVHRKDSKVVETMICTVSPLEVAHIVPHIVATYKRTGEDYVSLQDLMHSIDPTLIKDIVAQRRAAAERWLERPNTGIFFAVRIKQSILKALRKYPEIQITYGAAILIKNLQAITIDCHRPSTH